VEDDPSVENDQAAVVAVLPAYNTCEKEQDAKV
jgi:hypothetical protein